jgi:hypothetical protein
MIDRAAPRWLGLSMAWAASFVLVDRLWQRMVVDRRVTRAARLAPS